MVLEQEHPFKCTCAALYPSQQNAKNTRSSASHMVRTPIQVHPCRAVSLPAMPAPAQHCLQPNCKDTRSSAPTQQCKCTRTALPSIWHQVQPRRTASMPVKWQEHPFKHASQMVRTPSSAPAQHCIHASHMVRTPVQDARNRHKLYLKCLSKWVAMSLPQQMSLIELFYTRTLMMDILREVM